MIIKTNFIVGLILSFSSVIVKIYAEPDPNFHIYLGFGQSNMEGQAYSEDEERTVDKRFQFLSTVEGCNNHKLGEWYDAIPPLAHCKGRVGPMDYFGRTLVKKLPKQIRVGVVVVAVSGCDIQLFEKENYQNYEVPSWMQDIVDYYDGNPYGRLVEMGKIAQKYGVIKGILLHQGEANTGQETWPERVKKVYENLLKDLDLQADKVPLLVGEVVRSELCGVCGEHNAIIQKLPEIIPTAHIISSEGLEPKKDCIHFTHENYIKLGERYAEEMLKLLGNVEIVNDQSESNSCWSDALGYPCCKDTNVIYYLDESGEWGIENNNWCGIISSNNDEENQDNHPSSCWAKTLGYDCCPIDSCRNILYVDSDGSWDVENNQWCGITSNNTLC